MTSPRMSGFYPRSDRKRAITPFIAGYGVELLFSAMDRLIGAFTSEFAGK